MSTILSPLTLVSRIPFFSAGGSWIYLRYHYSIRLDETDGTNFVAIGTIKEGMLLSLGILGAARTAGQFIQFKAAVATGVTINGVVPHPLMSNTNGNSGGAASWFAFPEINNANTVFITNATALARFADDFTIDVGANWVIPSIGMVTALGAGLTQTMGGYVELVGLLYTGDVTGRTS